MKRLLLILLAASPGLCAKQEMQSTMRFTNNDQLDGQLQSMDTSALLWSSTMLTKPVPFHIDRVLDLTLPGEFVAGDAGHVAVLTLKNGDVARGQLVAISDEAITLDTWYAGTMHFNRPMVSTIRIESHSHHYYRGPNNLDGWIQSEDPPAWKYSRFALVSGSRGSIARDDVLPEQCSISLDVEWKSDAVDLKVLLFSDEPASQRPDSGYELSFQRTSIYLRNGKGRNFLGSAHSRDLAQNDKAHIEIRASRITGRISLRINGTPVEVWNDPQVEKATFGSALHFISGNTKPLRISNITVSPWDGKVDAIPAVRQAWRGRAPAPKPQEPATDGEDRNRMELANGDTLTGEVTDIRDGTAVIDTPLGEILIPVERFRSLRLKNLDLERCIRRNGDIRAAFPDGTTLVFRLDAVDGDTIHGSSQNFGQASFRLPTMSRIEFNLYDPEIQEQRQRQDW